MMPVGPSFSVACHSATAGYRAKVSTTTYERLRRLCMDRRDWYLAEAERAKVAGDRDAMLRHEGSAVACNGLLRDYDEAERTDND
jgi:hypothetical protein